MPMPMSDAPDPRDLLAESRDRWDANAAWWDERTGDGNAFQLEIVNPPFDALLDIRSGERLLDVGCGNGALARRMAARGARVLGVDFSERFIDLARGHGTPEGPDIAYATCDATDASALRSIAGAPFDAVTANMVLMDLVDLAPLAMALPRLLRPGGRFVFSVLHPCFNQAGATPVAEQGVGPDGNLAVRSALRIDRYAGERASLGIGIPGQPAPHVYVDRPLSSLLGPFLAAGLAVDGLAEPCDPGPADPERPFSFASLPGIPPALVARLRRP